MITHADAERLIATEIDFPLATDERRLLDEHLAGCARCAAIRTRMRADARALASLEPMDAPISVRRAVVEGTGDAPRAGGRAFLLLAAAVLMVVLTVGGIVVGSQLLDLRERTDLTDASASPTPSASASLDPKAPLPIGMAEVLVGDLPIRAEANGPGELLESTIAQGELLYVFAGPEPVDGSPWYGVQRRDGSFGWVPLLDADTPLLAAHELACPSGPAEVASIQAMHPAERLLCNGEEELVLRAWIPMTYAFGGDPGYDAEPAWLAAPFVVQMASAIQEEYWTSGIMFRQDPQVLSHLSPNQWVELTGHFDDPRADECRRTYRPDYTGDELDGSLVVLECREQFVVTDFNQLPFPLAAASRNGRIVFDAPGAAGDARDVFTVEADGSDRQSLTAGSGAEERNAVWSPDGQHVAYISSANDASVLVAGPDFHAPTVVISGGYAWGTYFSDGIAWSPYSNRLAVAMVEGGIRIVDLEGNVLDEIPTGEARYLAWSPSGTWLAYAEGSNLVAVHMYDGSMVPLALMDSNVRFPSWTPDERRIYFIGYAADGNTEIYSVGSDATGLTNVTNTPDLYEDEAYLSPDGEQLAMITVVGATQRVDVLDLASGERRTLRQMDGFGVAVWSPDGTRLAVGDDERLWVVPLDGGTAIDLGAGSAPHWQPLPS